MFYETVQDSFRPFMEDEEDILLDGLDRLADYFGVFQPSQRSAPVFATRNLALQPTPNSSAPVTQQSIREPSSQSRKESQKNKSLKRKRCCRCNCHEDKTEKKSFTKESSWSSTNGNSKLKNHNTSSTAKASAPEAKTSNFEVRLDVDSRYEPGELKVKLSGDNRSLIVEGCHQESRNNEFGFSQLSTQIYQRFSVPENVNVEALQCGLDGRGGMVISAPMRLSALVDGKEKQDCKEMVIPVIRSVNSQ